MIKITPKADKEYNALVELMLKIDEKRKAGWLLLDEDGHTNVYPVIFKDSRSNDIIGFQIGHNSSSILMEYGATRFFGAKTFLGEVRAAKKFVIENYKMLEPKQIHKISEI